MIDLFTGTPGSGKSLHMARCIYDAIKADRPVIANFEFKAYDMEVKNKKGGYLYLKNSLLTPDKLIAFSEYYKKNIYKKDRLPEEHILLCIDECQIQFNARQWQGEERRAWIPFFTQHRKLGYHIILVCQFNEMLDKQIRAVIEYEYIHRKLGNIGIQGKLLKPFTGDFIYLKFYAPMNMKTGSRFFVLNKHIYSLYDSYTHFEE